MTAVATLPEPGIDLSDAIDRTGTRDVYAKAERYAQAAKDAIVDTRILSMKDDANLWVQSQGLTLLVGDTAHRQIAEKVGIPFDYYQRMKTSQPDLLARNVNRWLTAEPNRHMLRMLTPVTEDEGRAASAVGAQYRLRAVLSPKFKILDNAALLNVVLPVAAQHGATVSSFNYTDDRFSLRLIGPGKTLEDLRREHGYGTKADAAHKFVREILHFGLSLTNSETGFAALLAEAFAEIAQCLNGLIVSERMRAIHVGAKKEDGFVSEDVSRLEAAAIFLRVRDKAEELFSPDTEAKTARAIEAGITKVFELPEELPMFEFVDGVGLTFDLSEKEREILKEETMKDVARNGYEFNQFSLSQGMTALARRAGAEDFDRRVELERAGWEVLTSPVEKLVKQAKAHLN